MRRPPPRRHRSGGRGDAASRGSHRRAADTTTTVTCTGSPPGWPRGREVPGTAATAARSGYRIRPQCSRLQTRVKRTLPATRPARQGVPGRRRISRKAWARRPNPRERDPLPPANAGHAGRRVGRCSTGGVLDGWRGRRSVGRGRCSAGGMRCSAGGVWCRAGLWARCLAGCRRHPAQWAAGRPLNGSRTRCSARLGRAAHGLRAGGCGHALAARHGNSLSRLGAGPSRLLGRVRRRRPPRRGRVHPRPCCGEMGEWAGPAGGGVREGEWVVRSAGFEPALDGT